MTDVIPKSTEEWSLSFSIFEEDNPLSLINLIDSEKWKETLQRMRVECPKMFFASEKDIQSKAQPTPVVYRLRLAFWDEYERAIATRSKMKLIDVVSNHCDRKYFYESIMTNNMYMLFIITPPRNYELAQRHILDQTTQRLTEVAEISPVDAEGRVDYKLAALQIKIHMQAEARVKGSIAQRLQIQSHVLNQQIPPEDKIYETLSVRELEKLRDRVVDHKEALKAPVIDVEEAE
jgi:hypothetical protein